VSAYLIARVRVSDPVGYEQYKTLASAAIEKHGGRYRARGGRTVTLEGDEETDRVVIVEFPSLEQAQAFYRSPEYREAIGARRGCATGQFIVIEGVK
jgi:uncharacterized protein (DUF1330 family)